MIAAQARSSISILVRQIHQAYTSARRRQCETTQWDLPLSPAGEPPLVERSGHGRGHDLPGRELEGEQRQPRVFEPSGDGLVQHLAELRERLRAGDAAGQLENLGKEAVAL